MLVLRQWPTVVGGVVAVLAGAALALSSLAAREPFPLVWWGLALAGLGWLLAAGPRLAVHDRGLVIRNPLRTVRVPWERFDLATARWVLIVWAGDVKHEVFGIVSHADRSAGRAGSPTGGVLGGGRLAGAADELSGRPGERAARPTAGPGRDARGRVTPGAAAALLTGAHEDWAEGVAEGVLVPDPDARVTRSVDPVGALAVLAVLAGAVGITAAILA